MPHLTGRRAFLGGLLAAGLVPKPTWADAGSPAFLAAAARSDGSYLLCGIGEDLGILFRIPLPDRGHAAASHPIRPEAVAFARRPGTFAIVIDCVSGRPKARLTSPEGRHFYGHGAFSADGNWLFTPENDYEAGEGRIGVWDVANGYIRAAEFDSGGVGPHDIKRLPGTDTMVVANGGIDTHPDSGRSKLNIATMEPNLSYIENGEVIDQATLDRELHKNSIRHLAVSRSGLVAFGMQWQGDGDPSALVGLHRMGGDVQLCSAPENETRRMEGYVGSVALSEDGKQVAVTSPRGGLVQLYSTSDASLAATVDLQDACGIASSGKSFIASNGQGILAAIDARVQAQHAHAETAWDNHLVRV